MNQKNLFGENNRLIKWPHLFCGSLFLSQGKELCNVSEKEKYSVISVIGFDNIFCFNNIHTDLVNILPLPMLSQNITKSLL